MRASTIRDWFRIFMIWAIAIAIVAFFLVHPSHAQVIENVTICHERGDTEEIIDAVADYGDEMAGNIARQKFEAEACFLAPVTPGTAPIIVYTRKTTVLMLAVVQVQSPMDGSYAYAFLQRQLMRSEISSGA